MFRDLGGLLDDLIQGTTPEGRERARRARERRWRTLLKIVQRMLAAVFAILAAGVAWGLAVAPLGILGVMAVLLAALVACVAIAALSSPVETPARIAGADLAGLPERVEAWLEAQRPQLPPPAQRQVDGLCGRLEALGPQLAGLDPREPAAAAVRTLVGDELPGLVEHYLRVPAGLRATAKDGPAPDAELAEGLRTIDGALGRMTEQLARGDLAGLATQGRYLELKYRGGAVG